MKKIIIHCNYIQGFIRNGHLELELSDEEFKKFEVLSKEDKIDWIKEDGELYIDSYRVEDYEVGDEIEILNS